MSHDHEDALKQKAETHREALTNTANVLIDILSPKTQGDAAVEQVSQVGQQIASKAMNAARENPAALALLATGAAMLLMPRTSTPPDAAPADASEAMQGFDERLRAADARMARQARVEQHHFTHPGASAQGLRKTLDAGLDSLSPDARDRIKTARLKAIEAQDALERKAARVASQARAAHASQPFVTGLLVAGIGAIGGALLPATRKEDELMGAHRDQLMRDAEAMLKSEIAALETHGKQAVSKTLDRSIQQAG